jgi:membrane protease YdiL (CAAX protease family)
MGQTQELTVHHFRLVIAVTKKLLLAFAALFGAVLFVRMLLLPGLQAIFHPDDSVTSLVRRTGIIVSAVLAYWAYVRIVEGRDASELRPATRAIMLGGASGGLLMAISMLLALALGAYEISAYPGLQHGLLGIAGLIVIAATLEEIAYRCILFRILETAWGTVPALCLQSVIFALGHLENIEGRASMQELVTMIVSTTLTGALWTLVFVLSRNLWAAAANHAAWNFTIILSGLPLSGIEDWRHMAPMAGEYRGPVWLTGGLFGPESSIVTIVMLAVTVAAMLYWAKRKNRLIGGAAWRVDTLKPLQPEARHA